MVEEPLDLIALDKTGVYKGLYHVLHGRISPMDGIGVKDLRINELVRRVEESPAVREIILAMNPASLGDITALYVKDELSKIHRQELRITALARGLSNNSDLEYADEGTLSRALEGRRDMQ